MKNIIIIGTYPNDSYKLDMLNDCINRVKPLGYDIMIVSHYPIPEEIQSKVNYVLYDSENIKVYGCIIVLIKDDGTFEEFRISKEVQNTIFEMDMKKYLKK
jgi:hypothetical protein